MSNDDPNRRYDDEVHNLAPVPAFYRTDSLNPFQQIEPHIRPHEADIPVYRHDVFAPPPMENATVSEKPHPCLLTSAIGVAINAPLNDPYLNRAKILDFVAIPQPDRQVKPTETNSNQIYAGRPRSDVLSSSNDSSLAETSSYLFASADATATSSMALDKIPFGRVDSHIYLSAASFQGN